MARLSAEVIPPPRRILRVVKADAEDYVAEVERWHADRDARLRSPDGWLALVGLHWLTPGEHEFGQHPSNAVRMSGRGVPPLAGHLLVTDDGAVRVRPHGDAPLTHSGQLITEELGLQDDLAGDPTIVQLGSLRFHLIRRGERVGLRVRDAESPALLSFQSVPRFPVDPAWRLVARFEPADPAQTVEVPDVRRVTDLLARLEVLPGQVLVIDARGELSAGVLGDVLATRLMVRGGVAVVTDGAVRDLPAMQELGLPLFARGVHTANFGQAQLLQT